MMRRSKNSATHANSKKGGASLYVVIFTALILSIISLSYVRIMLSNATQTTNTDLSQSAYDSALAGIEDAKVALLKYHDCLSQGYTSDKDDGSTKGKICREVIADMEEGIAEQSCDVVNNVLNRIAKGDQGETLLEETNTNIGNNSTDLAQAYTCVKIREELKDYRSTLTANDRVRLVPLRSAEVKDAKYVKIGWFSDNNHVVSGGLVPTMLGVDIYQTDVYGFTLAELAAGNGTVGTDHAKIFLNPSRGNTATNISAAQILDASDKADNDIFQVNCTESNIGDDVHNGFACVAILELPKTFNGSDQRADSTFFLRLTLPYGEPITDFSINLCQTQDCTNSNAISFTGVQAMIDSTGRANDLFRRVEARIELVDNYYPYPEFEIQLDDSNGSLEKRFWVTKKCWGTDDNKSASDKVDARPCNDSGTFGTSSL